MHHILQKGCLAQLGMISMTIGKNPKLPINLEGQTFLKENKKFWDVKTAAAIVNKTFEIIIQLQ